MEVNQTLLTKTKIRKQHMEILHGHMDEQISKRRYRLLQAQVAGDTTIQWDLIAAAMEEANIDYHQLKGPRSHQDEREIESCFPKE